MGARDQAGRHGSAEDSALRPQCAGQRERWDARRVAAAVLPHSEAAAANALGKKGLFVAFRPKNFDKVPDAAKDANGLFVGQRLNMMTHYLRSDKIATPDEPKTWN